MNIKKNSLLRSAWPLVYYNWLAALRGDALQIICEYPLFTDAWITGQITSGFGPYKFLNPVPLRNRPGLVQPAIILRAELHTQFLTPDTTETNIDCYGERVLTGEITALSSLALGIRLRSGGIIREFEPLGDPMGTPRAWHIHPDPVVLIGSYGLILPSAVGGHSLGRLQPLSALPDLSSSQTITLVRAARLYQDALWIAESEPSLSWIMLVSSIEAAAGHWCITEDSPLEMLKNSKPELVCLLVATDIEDLPSKVAEHIADSLGSTKKFVDFVMNFLPPAPPVRPPEWVQHPWDTRQLKKTMRLIYKYRSDALHGGLPFPGPMCQPAYQHKDWNAPAERPLDGSSITMSQAPMLLSTFEYIVRHALLNWWKSMATK